MTRTGNIGISITIIFFLLVLAVFIARWADQEKRAGYVMPILGQGQEEKSRLDLATPQKGEGIESAFIRQLIANPIGYKGKQESALIKEWAQGEADRLARKFGFIVYKNGRIVKEIRIKGNGGDTAYLIVYKNGQRTVEKYSKVKGAFRAKPDFTISAKEIGKAQFCADVAGCLQPYEYIVNKIDKRKEKYSESKKALSLTAAAHGHAYHGGDSRHGRAGT